MPLLPAKFSLEINKITKNIQGRVPWCMVFVDDIVLVEEVKSKWTMEN